MSSKGLRAGDLIVKFGPLTAENISGSLQPIAQQVECSENVRFPIRHCYPPDRTLLATYSTVSFKKRPCDSHSAYTLEWLGWSGNGWVRHLFLSQTRT